MRWPECSRPLNVAGASVRAPGTFVGWLVVSQKPLRPGCALRCTHLAPPHLSTPLATAEIMNGHKSRHKFRTWDGVWVWCEEDLPINKGWLPLNVFRACVNRVKTSKIHCPFSLRKWENLQYLSWVSWVMWGYTNLRFRERHTLTLFVSREPESASLAGRLAHFRKLHRLLYLG